MKKYLTFIIVIIMLFPVLSGCSSNDRTLSKRNDSAGGNNQELTWRDFLFNGNGETGKQESADTVISVDVFKDVLISFSGISGHGTVVIDTTNCEQWIQENVLFTLDESTNGKYSNGDYAQVSVSFDPSILLALQYSVENTSVSVEVAGLIEVTGSSDYHDGRAWISYSQNGQSFLGSIDKEGKEVFRLPSSNIAKYEDYSNGFAYYWTENGDFSVIDMEGNLLHTYTEAEEGTVLAYGDGYVFCTTHISNFDTAYDSYRFYDSGGNMISSCEIENFGDAQYCGEGVFGISLRGSWDWSASFYNAKLNKWILSGDEGIGSCNDHRFENGIICLGAEYYDPDEMGGYRSAILTMTDVGEINGFLLNYGWSWNDYGFGLFDGCIVLVETYDNEIYCFDVGSHTETKMDTYYSSRVDFNTWNISEETGFSNGRIAIPLKGDDGVNYIAMFNKQWEIVLAPIPYDKYIGLSDNRLVIIENGTPTVYDENGNKLFTSFDCFADSISAYSDGVSKIENGKYIDADGNLLFESFVPLDVQIQS